MKSEFDQYTYCPVCKKALFVKTEEKQKVKECKSCGFIYWNNPKPSVSSIIDNNSQVLMLQRARDPFKDFWVLPGGFVGNLETPEEAVVRETKEETTLTITVNKLLGIYMIETDPRGIDMDIIYKTSGQGAILLRKNEHVNWKYFSANNLPEHIAYKHREAIRDYFASK